jgi:hypothetical protein
LGLTIFEKMPVNEIFIKNVKEQTSEDYPMLFNISDF